MFAYIALSILVALLAPLLFTLWNYYNTSLRKIPVAPGAEFPFGHIRLMRTADTGVFQRKWSQMFGLFRIQFFLTWRVYVTDPKALSKIFTTSAYDYPKPSQMRNFISLLLGQGLLVAEGAEHKKQRRALDSAFSLPRIKEITPIFWGPGRSLKIWQDMVPSSTESVRLDVLPWLSRCTLDIIGLAGFDYNFDSLHKPDDPLAHCYNKLFGDTEQFPLSVLLLTALNDYFPFALQLRSRLAYMKNIYRKETEVITQRMLEEERSEMNRSEKKDILSVLVRDNLGSEDSLNDKEITDQCLTFLAAGHETTSTSLTWTLQRLAENPEVQDKLRRELLEAFPEDRDLSYDEINSLPYLTAVTREVLRLDSPVPSTSRQAQKDDVLCGYDIPKGTVLMIPPCIVHYHPDIWGPDAEQFRPERFVEQGGPYANLAFLATEELYRAEVCKILLTVTESL
ncbi:hypothetical protein PROFUN_00753 [Planoprotostelium fungivorum]|uniref:Cytochrome P450 n=1 Tax=Planoprotostelium fungivorum TaxID=1890364 RepID=A0A2P6NU99_9EUKA|nr:hypothetical protein PROFUN_00753 [Planoprotostelium fungivorum]